MSSLRTILRDQSNSWDDVLRSKLALLSNVSASSAPHVIYRSRMQLDDEVKDLQKIICAIQSRRNTLSPIARLPAEIISRVFLVVADTSFHGYVVSHVCRHWRQVAFAHSGFWGRNVCAVGGWTAEQLARSKQSLITIASVIKPASARKDVKTLALALREIHRVQHVKLRLCEGVELGQGVIDSQLKRAAPLLESLQIDSSNHSTLPCDFLLRQAPRLTALTLNKCTTIRQPWLYQNLIEFSYDSSTSVFFPSADLLSALVSMPKLRFLVLKNPVRFGDLPGGPPVELSPSLQAVSIDGTWTTCSWVFRRVAIPPRTKIFCNPMIDVSRRALDDTSLLSLLPGVALKSSNAPGPQTILLDCFDAGEWAIKGWMHVAGHAETSKSRDFDDCKEHDTPLFSLRGHGLHLRDSNFMTSFLCAVTGGMSLEDVTVLHIADRYASYGTPRIVRECCTSLFPRFSAVKSLYLHGDVSVTILMAILGTEASLATSGGFIGAGDRDALSQRLFPRLRSLLLVDFDFFHGAPPMAHKHAFGILCDTIESRVTLQKGNAILERIKIKQCRVTPQHISELEKYGIVVEWDGLEDGITRSRMIQPNYASDLLSAPYDQHFSGDFPQLDFEEWPMQVLPLELFS